MRLLRTVLVLAFMGLLVWLAVRTVRVESTDDAVQITIDKRRLQEAGQALKAQGRRVADQFGHSLQEAGKQIDSAAGDSTRR